jgi:hypothetical protein
MGVLAVYVFYTVLSGRTKKPTFYSFTTCILLAIIFLSYQTLVIQNTFSGIIKELSDQISSRQNQVLTVAQGRVIASHAFQVEQYAIYCIIIINFIIAISAILVALFGFFKRKKETKYDVIWIVWIILAALLVATVNYGSEAIQRAFLIMLLPTCYFAVKYLGKKPIILFLVMAVLIFAYIPAVYTAENYLYVPSSELRGDSFYGRFAPSGSSFLYEPVSAFLPQQPNGSEISLTTIAGTRSLPSQTVIDRTVWESTFIINSNLKTNFYMYYYGVNPYENSSFSNFPSRVYDNGELNILARVR